MIKATDLTRKSKKGQSFNKFRNTSKVSGTEINPTKEPIEFVFRTEQLFQKVCLYSNIHV